jgi:hypothetical protein
MMKKTLLLLALVAMVLPAAGLAQIEVVTNDGGLVTVDNPLDATCVRNGSYGMRVTATTGEITRQYVEATPPKANFQAEKDVTVEFWFNPADMEIANGTKHFIFVARPDASSKQLNPFRLQFRQNALEENKLIMRCRNDCPTENCQNSSSGVMDLATTGWHLIRATWSSGTGSSDGLCRVEVVEGPDGATSQEKTDGNYSQYNIGGVRLGLIGGAAAGTDINWTGKNCFDDFVATRTAP